MIVSADSHVVEPGDLWIRYIDPAYREVAPRLVREQGSDVFVAADSRVANIGTLGSGGNAAEEIRREGTFEEVRRGGWDPAARIADMDLDGVEAEIIYPSFGLQIIRLDDRGYQQACQRAYNRWLAEFCRFAPARLNGVGMVTVEDVDSALAELQRFPELGFVSVMINAHSYEDLPFYDAEFDPFWATVAEMDLPVSLHIGTERKRAPGARTPVEAVLFQVAIQKAVAELVIGGVFDRHPKLKIVSVENDAGWAAAFYERMDYKVKKNAGLQAFSCQETPSFYGRRNLFHTFIIDHLAVAARDFLGVSQLMWSSDYPHFDGSWPKSREAIEDHLGAIPTAERELIAGGNAARIYHLAETT